MKEEETTHFGKTGSFTMDSKGKRGVKTEISFIMNSEGKIYTITRD